MKVSIQLVEQVSVECQLSDEFGVHVWARANSMVLITREGRHDGPDDLYRIYMKWQRPVGLHQNHGFLPANISEMLAKTNANS
jgi:hypothetical protein